MSKAPSSPTGALLIEPSLIEQPLTGALRIERWQVQWRDAFRDLNLEWLQQYFVVENVDHAVLSDPETHIIQPGGDILFVLRDEVPVATCALLRASDDEVELTKMAVTASCRGQGIGRRLLQAAINRFRELPARTLYLESSSRLEPALALYRSVGFELQSSPRPGSHYARADVYMIWRAPATT